MKRTGILFLLLVFLAANPRAQRYSFTHYTTNDGLVQTDITDIKQDARGNIWIGTAGGLSVYDGKRFTNYDDHDLLQSLRINALLCSADGAVWIATGNGLLKYDNGFRVFFKPRGGRNHSVSCVSANSQNTLVFVCNDTVYQVRQNRVEKLRLNNAVENKAALVAFDREDRLWIVTTDLAVYRKAGGQLTAIKTPFTAIDRKHGMGILRLLGKEAPEPYFVTNLGSLRVRGDSLQYFSQQFPNYSDARIGQATYALEGPDSTLWVGGVVGLSKLAGNKVTRYAAENGFCDNSVSCLFTDRERNLWIGCTYNGVYKLSNEALFHLEPSNPTFSLHHVSQILTLPARKTLLGTWGKGLYLYNGDSVSKITLPSYLRYVTSLISIGGYTYIGWFGPGLLRMNNANFQTGNVAGFPKDEAVGSMARLGNEVLVQMLDNNCYVTDTAFRIQSSIRLPEGAYLRVLNGNIYRISDYSQVDLLNRSFQPVQTNLFPEVTARIRQITLYRDHFLIGTYGQGLFLYGPTGKLLQRLDKKSGLPTNVVTSLLVDGNQVYIGSNLGLMRADLPGLQNLKVFQESEGMFSWECRPDGLQKLPGGGILIATTNGPYVYHPSKDAATQYASAVLSVAGIRFGDDGSKQAPFSPLSPQIKLADALDYKDNRMAITLCGVSQRAPHGVLYRYQLSGFDSMWVTTADPALTFNNLPPGAYKLKAYATVGGVPSNPLSIAFAIDKPLSGRLWFQVLLVLFLSGLGWVLLTVGNRLYQRYIQTRMVGKMEAGIAAKRQLTAQSVAFARDQYKELGDALRRRTNGERLEHLTPVFLKDVASRIQLLWKKDKLTLEEFHDYFDELLAGYSTGAKLYHKRAMDGLEMPVEPAFQLLQIFSLYVFIALYESETAVFGLDSENKSNGQVLLRLYDLTHESGRANPSSYHLLKEAIGQHRNGGMTVDVIENLEFGNTVVAELNLQNENGL